MKRIITCNDGTWNQPGTTDQGAGVMTNVEKLFKMIPAMDGQGTPQFCYYDEGVGTSPGVINQLVGGVTGEGIDKNIKDTYRFLMWNYEGPEDELFLFGFSRGAYTARSLAGFIRNIGILKPSNLHLVDEAYELYRDRTFVTHPDSDAMKSFRRNYCFNGEGVTPIHCIGVWDTVGALGIPFNIRLIQDKARYNFHDVTLSSWVRNAFHALAIDERRAIFMPTLWEASKNMPANNRLEQVWFSGVHANVGGGYAQSGLSDIALDWMIAKAEEVGLQVDKNLLVDDSASAKPVSICPMVKGFMRDSIADFWLYRLAEKKSRQMLLNRLPSPAFKDTHEKIHRSALLRLEAGIDPRPSPELIKSQTIITPDLIDDTAMTLVDTTTVETKASGAELTQGDKIRQGVKQRIS
jgi:uncharacterized protein (DUF2235 family)